MTKLNICLTLLLCVACGKGFKNDESQSSRSNQESDAYSVNQQYISLVNEYRIRKKLSPLSSQVLIEEAAEAHSKGMALHTRPFGHYGFSLRCRRLSSRLGVTKACGEVVAKGHKSAKEVLSAWLKSPIHRQHIEANYYTHTGLGVHKDSNGEMYWTQIFIEL
jgi:uncharacterized protein YkwD